MKKIINHVPFVFLIASAGWAQQNYPYCQILDRVDTPPWQASAGYVTREDVEAPDDTGDDVGWLELKGGGGLAYYRSSLGDFDLGSTVDLYTLAGDGGISLPDQLIALSFNAAYIRRNWNGQALRLDAHPGLYSDMEDLSSDDVYIPFGLSGIQAFNPEMSGLLGVEIYPGFDRSFDPRFGLRWAPGDSWLIDLMYPESKIVYTPSIDWDFYAGIKVNNVAEYRLEEGDDRETLEYDETRLYIGVNTPYSDTMRIMYQAGTVIERSIDFGHLAEEMDVNDGYFLRIGLAGML